MKLLRKIVLLFSAVALVWPVTARAQSLSDRCYLVNQVCSLAEQDRLVDAIDVAVHAKHLYPNDPLVLNAHGLVALLAGDIPIAEADYNRSLFLSKSNFSEYGLALCEMLQNRSEETLLRVNVINSSKVTGADAAACLFVFRSVFTNWTHSNCESISASAESDEPAIAEITASQPSSTSRQMSLLRELLSEGQVNGLPRVVEIDSMRLTLSSDGPPIEPAVNDPDEQQLLADCFSTDLPTPQTLDQGLAFSGNAPPPENSQNELMERMWRLLTIEPSYTWAEYRLALCYAAEHNHDAYALHILRTAALNPNYKDVRERIHPLFLGVAPTAYPLPRGMSLPSSMGLSAGTASRRGLWIGSPVGDEMALTFDDGPVPGPCRDLLNALKSSHAKATFFVVGMKAVQSPDSLRLMEDDSDEIEDHSYSHPNLTQVLPQHVLQEIVRTAVIIQAATGKWPHYLRPPGGNTDNLVLDTARACGMSGAFWTVDALPAEESGSPSVVARWVISYARSGAIVLMHNGMPATVAAIPQIVVGLRKHGFRLVTLRQLADDAIKNAVQNLTTIELSEELTSIKLHKE